MGVFRSLCHGPVPSLCSHHGFMSPHEVPAPWPCSGSRSPCHVPVLGLCPHGMTHPCPHAVSPPQLQVLMPWPISRSLPSLHVPIPSPCPRAMSLLCALPVGCQSCLRPEHSSLHRLPVRAGRERVPQRGDSKGDGWVSPCPTPLPTGCHVTCPKPPGGTARPPRPSLPGPQPNRNPTLTLSPSLSLYGCSHSDNSPIPCSVPTAAPP